MIDLIKGDCLDSMKSIPNGSIDAIITDPPYGTTACKWDSVIPFDPMWKQLNRVIKHNGVIVLFGSEPFSSALRMSNITNYKYDWVWDKKISTNVLNCNKMPLKRNELISVFYKKSPTYNPIMRVGKPRLKGKVSYSETNARVKHKEGQKTYISNKYYPTTILDISNANMKGRLHPTQKPVALMEYLIKTYTNENETVLDFTMGSGTTGVACKNLNRDFVGIEMDVNYYSVAIERLA